MQESAEKSTMDRKVDKGMLFLKKQTKVACELLFTKRVLSTGYALYKEERIKTKLSF